MLNRHIDSVIERHYATTRKALLLTGTRQTGKTYAIRRAIVLSNENVSVTGNVLYVPIYMTMFLHHHKQDGPIIYHPELP